MQSTQFPKKGQTIVEPKDKAGYVEHVQRTKSANTTVRVRQDGKTKIFMLFQHQSVKVK